MKKIMVIPGDGIGPEVVSATVQAITSLTDEFEFIQGDAGLNYFRRNSKGLSISRETTDNLKECDAVLLGTIEHGWDERGYRNPEMELIQRFDLQINVRRIRNVIPGIGKDDESAIVVSNNSTPGTITEMEDYDGYTKQIRMQTKTCKRILDVTKIMAEEYRKNTISCIHSGHLFRESDMTFLQMFYDELHDSEIELLNKPLDEWMSDIILGEKETSIIATLECYAKIVGDTLSAAMGERHLSASMDLGEDFAIFKPSHGTNPHMAEANYANPTASIMSGVMLLKYFGMDEESNILQDAVRSAYKRGFDTKDVGGSTGTYDFANQVAKYCQNPF